ncbi:MAG TPA: hypothetical protein VGO67_18615 [Verrucomicrobiae bacterium]|jgi:hypothetical protein
MQLDPSPDPNAPPRPAAWQPLTFGGVAAFASARPGRLLLLGFVTTGLFAAAFVWFLARDYRPIIVQAIQKMPESARLENGKITGVTNVMTSESKLLGIVVTPATSSEIGQGADLQIQARQTDFCVNSIFRPDWGMVFDYDKAWSASLGRSALEPWWGAWNPVLLTIAGLSALVGVFVLWIVMSTLYTAPARFAAWFMDRDLSWTGAWRLCFAAMAPGTLLMTLAILLYGLQAIDLLKLSLLWAAHLLTGWLYIAGAIWSTPRLFAPPLKTNPFIKPI